MVSEDHWNIFFTITNRCAKGVEWKKDQLFNTLQTKTKIWLGERNTVMNHGLKQWGFITYLKQTIFCLDMCACGFVSVYIDVFVCV